MISVLYIDEEATPLEPIKLLLEMTTDMKVDVAQSLMDGMKRLVGGGVDVVVIGCRKGDVDCVKTLRRLRSEGNCIPLVILCDAFNEMVRDEVVKLKDSAFLSRENNPTKELLLLTETINRLATRKPN